MLEGLVLQDKYNRQRLEGAVQSLKTFNHDAGDPTIDRDVELVLAQRRSSAQFMYATRQYSNDTEKAMFVEWPFSVERVNATFSPSPEQHVILGKYSKSDDVYTLDDLFDVVQAMAKDTASLRETLSARDEELRNANATANTRKKLLEDARCRPRKPKLRSSSSNPTRKTQPPYTKQLSKASRASTSPSWMCSVQSILLLFPRQRTRLNARYAHVYMHLTTRADLDQDEELAQKQRDLDTARQDAETQRRSKDALERRNKDLHKQIESAKIQGDEDIRRELRKEQEAHNATTQKLRDSQADVDDKSGKIVDLEIALATTEDEKRKAAELSMERYDKIQSLTNELGDESRKVRTLQNVDIYRLNLEINTIQRRLTNAETKATSASEEHESLEKRTRKQIIELQAELSAAQVRAEEAARRATTAEFENTDLHGEVVSTRSKMNDAIDASTNMNTAMNVLREHMATALGYTIPEGSNLLQELLGLIRHASNPPPAPPSSVPGVDDEISRLQSRLTDTENRRKQAEESYASVQAAHTQLGSQNANLTRRLGDSEQRESGLMSERDNARNLLNEANDTKRELGQQVTDLQARIDSLDGTVRDKDEKIAGLEQQRDRVNDQLSSLRQEHQGLEEVFLATESAQKQWDEERQADSNKIKVLVEAIDGYKSSLEEKNGSITKLKDEVKDLKHQGSELRQAIDNATLQAEREREVSDQNVERTNKLQAHYDALLQKHDKLAGDSRNELNNARNDMRNTESANKYLEGQLSEARAERDERQDKINQFNTDKARWNLERNTMAEKINSLAQGESGKTTTISRLEDEKNQLQSQIITLTQSSNKLAKLRNDIKIVLENCRDVFLVSTRPSAIPDDSVSLLTGGMTLAMGLSSIDGVGMPKGLQWDFKSASKTLLLSLPSQDFERTAASLKVLLFLAPGSLQCRALLERLRDMVGCNSATQAGIRTILLAVDISLRHADRSIARSVSEAMGIEVAIRAANLLNLRLDGQSGMILKWTESLSSAHSTLEQDVYLHWLTGVSTQRITRCISMPDVLLAQIGNPLFIEEEVDDHQRHPRRIYIHGRMCLVVDLNDGNIASFMFREMGFDMPERSIYFKSSRRSTLTRTSQEPPFLVRLEDTDFIWDNMRDILGPRPADT